MIRENSPVRPLRGIKSELRGLGSPKKARILTGFFKTGPGGYAEGDRFIGVPVPLVRGIAGKHLDLSLPEIKVLISSRVHEERLLALLILVARFDKAADKERKKILDFYLRNTRHINNWDLVDLSAHQIIGRSLINKSRKIIYRLARSRNLWERRMAVVATYQLIKRSEFEDTFRIAAMLLEDKEELIHKAVGWMLREAGKRDQGKEEKFLDTTAARMPRTMLRYAIERFSAAKRSHYLGLKKNQAGK